MGRWEPNARGRLAETALRLYAEQGFETTTVAEIARQAGLTERTFFRHFSDKREVLFSGTELLEEGIARVIAEAPAEAGPMAAVGAALDAMAAALQQDPQRVRRREAVIAANRELRERELIKLARLALAIADALRDRGVPESTAYLAAETGVSVFKVAYARWIAGPDRPDLAEVVREAMKELKDVL